VIDQNDETGRYARSANTHTPPSRITEEAAGVTRLQVALATLEALLEASRAGTAREHAVFVDIASRRLSAERKRIAFSLRRWAA
jgi:hypothetical protein